MSVHEQWLRMMAPAKGLPAVIGRRSRDPSAPPRRADHGHDLPPAEEDLSEQDIAEVLRQVTLMVEQHRDWEEIERVAGHLLDTR